MSELPSPESRQDLYLSRIALGEGELPEGGPQSREEAYLKIIATGEGEYPEGGVQSREEAYLKYIAEHGGGGGEKPYAGLEKIAPYLYRIVFNELPDDAGYDSEIAGLCSSYVKDGKLYRNLDLGYNLNASFEVVTENFTGMSCLTELNEGEEFDDDILSQLPYHVNDGANKDGIMVSTHVLFNDWGWAETGSVPLTKLPFYILENVNSMDTIEEDLADVLGDLSVTPSLTASGYLLQFVVTDGYTTYVIEPPESETGSYVLIDASSNPKLTNFRWVSGSTVVRTDLQERPVGVERFNMMPIELHKLRYTKSYESPDWLSEFIGEMGTTKDSTDEDLTAVYDIARERYLERVRDGETWQTMHSIVYDGSKIQHLYIQEDWTKDYGANDILVTPLTVTENGTYNAGEDRAYNPVEVNIPLTEIVPISIEENGTYVAPMGRAYDPVEVNVPTMEIVPLYVAGNGTYTAEEGTAYSPVTVDVGGGGGGSVDSGVIFIDYDGSIVESWESDSVAGKTALPDNPTHEGLIAQGWNRSLANIKSYVSKYEGSKVVVGQMYKTASGLTEMDITVTKGTGLTVTCKMVGNKDWGDGTEDALTSHTYTDYGDYTITCDGTEIPAGTSSSGGMFGQNASNINKYWCTDVRIGEGVTSIGTYAFNNCYSLASVVIPDGVTVIDDDAFCSCYSLTSVVIPDGVTVIDVDAFCNCCSLTSVAIPGSVTSIGTGAFNNCDSLASVVIPDGVMIIDGAFCDCYSLTSVAIPDSVIIIGFNVFYNGYSILQYDFSVAIAVPVLSDAGSFHGINAICKIIVPDALYDEWIAATNWATYANYIYKASEV